MPAMTDWSKVKYFHQDENWGDPDKISQVLLTGLDDLRFRIKSPIIISSGTGGEHSENSFHYKGLAVDIIAPNIDLLNLFLQATCVKEFHGIGMYPEWTHRGVRCGGLHVDVGGKFGRRWLFHDAYYRELNAFYLRESQVI